MQEPWYYRQWDLAVGCLMVWMHSVSLGQVRNQTLKAWDFGMILPMIGLTPNVTGLPGIMEGYCPPYYHDMRGAVEAICERKFGPGGPFHEQTPGPWKDSAKVRSSAQIHDEQFRQCVALQAQYILDTFGKFPGTTPSIFCFIYLQAHHLDLDFYDSYYKNGAYLQSHADHISKWHSDNYQHDR